jgi:hypothetical protein
VDVSPAVRRLPAAYAEKLAAPALDGPERGAHRQWELPVEPAEEQALCRLAAARFAARSFAAQVESEPLDVRRLKLREKKLSRQDSSEARKRPQAFARLVQEVLPGAQEQPWLLRELPPVEPQLVAAGQMV